MDRNYLSFLRCLCSLVLYKNHGSSDLRKYRSYYAAGVSPYRAVLSLFDEEYTGGVIPSDIMEAMEHVYLNREPVTGYLPPYSQLKFNF